VTAESRVRIVEQSASPAKRELAFPSKRHHALTCSIWRLGSDSLKARMIINGDHGSVRSLAIVPTRMPPSGKWVHRLWGRLA